MNLILYSPPEDQPAYFFTNRIHSSRREDTILKKKKEFTLAELLIVVAIITVLVAISVPIFTSQLEKANQATDAANIRAAYAEAQVASLDADGAGGSTKTTVTTEASDFTYAKIGDPEIGGSNQKMSQIIIAKGTYTISVDKNGTITATAK